MRLRASFVVRFVRSPRYLCRHSRTARNPVVAARSMSATESRSVCRLQPARSAGAAGSPRLHQRLQIGIDSPAQRPKVVVLPKQRVKPPAHGEVIIAMQDRPRPHPTTELLVRLRHDQGTPRSASPMGPRYHNDWPGHVGESRRAAPDHGLHVGPGQVSSGHCASHHSESGRQR